MAKPRVYLETTIPSYLTARPSRDVIAAARQQITRDWWDKRRRYFDAYVSQLVRDEAGAGDPEAARSRLAIIENLPSLDISSDVPVVAKSILAAAKLPRKAATDASHIALAAVHGLDFLLTWNCVHIANAAITRQIAAACRKLGFECPVICTPEELMG